uniref:Transglycosylase SLT domain-containing protein n=1 Tax=mine drainage metagenome TaxID=410659 RepID=E6PE64_9ZZZZ
MTALSASASALAAHGVAYAAPIARAAARNGLDPSFLAAVAAQETGGPGVNAGRNILGDGGHGHGLFQIDDRYHAFARSPAAMDPAQNAERAAEMLHGLLQRYGGDEHAALSSYNAGSPNARGTTTRWTDGSVLGYADSVLRHQAQIEDARAELPSAAASAAGYGGSARGAPAIPLAPPPAASHGEQPWLDELAAESNASTPSL